MHRTRRTLTAFGLSVLLGSVLTAGATTAGTMAKMKPVIGEPVSVPAQPVAGKRFTVSFKVMRSDTGKPLRTGTMICDPSTAGKTIPHAESFKGGTARLSFVVPTSAQLLKVKVTIKSASQSATRVSAFKVTAAAVPSLSIADAQVAEGNAGTTMLVFPATLSAKSAQTVSVSYTSADGTATQPADYAAASGTLTFAPGETAKTIAVSVVGDVLIEADETLTVALSSPVKATIADGSATGTITNDDTTVPVTPGKYQGATQHGDYVFFTVMPSRTITELRFNALPETCSPPPMKLTGTVDFGKNTFAIKADGTFSKEFKGPRQTWKVTGAFSGSLAQGTVVLSDSFDRNGTHYECSSGVVTWSATLQG